MDERKIRGKEIEEELFSLVCFCMKSEKKEKIMMPNNNFTFMLVWKGISTINIESDKKLLKI